MDATQEIKIIEIKPLLNGGLVRAYVTVSVGDWIVYDWRVIQREGERILVSVPQTSWKNREGQVRYRALLTIPGELKQRIEVAILSAWEKENPSERRKEP